MFFGVIDFLQEMNKQIRLYYYDTLGRLVFVRFLEEIDDPKKPFWNQLTSKTTTKKVFGHSIKYEKHGQSFSAAYKKERIFLGKEASHFAYDHISAPFISQWRREKLRQQLLHIDALCQNLVHCTMLVLIDFCTLTE